MKRQQQQQQNRIVRSVCGKTYTYENEKENRFFRVAEKIYKNKNKKKRKTGKNSGGRCWGVSNEVSFSISLESSTIRL